MIRDTYGNTQSTGYTLNWFEQSASGAQYAYLASPFFNTYKPVEIFTKRGCKVNLLVRLCSITSPAALQAVLKDDLVQVRYYTDREFHAKLYIAGETALVGSANLTESGLLRNREISVVLRKDRDPGFDDLIALYNLLWSSAITFTPDILKQYELAYKRIGNPQEEAQFQKSLEALVPAAHVPNAKVGSEKVSKERAFLQRYQEKYDEELIPAFREVERIFAEFGHRRPEFAGEDPRIEIGRFLGWMRLVNASGDKWEQASLAEAAERKQRILANLEEWLTSTDTRAGDIYDGDKEVARIKHLRQAMSSSDAINAMTYDELLSALMCVHAFEDRLRHVAGGAVSLKAQFQERNSLDHAKQTLAYLLHGSGITLERAYDCIQNENWKLSGFAEGCVMELLGWMDKARPPINGRTIKALRFLGFDVQT